MSVFVQPQRRHRRGEEIEELGWKKGAEVGVRWGEGERGEGGEIVVAAQIKK